MGRPRLLDLFCGAGGASRGYADAGFEVVGVDHLRQPNYPFEFHRADALSFPLEGFDAYHASPPCQFATDHVQGAEAAWLFNPHLDLIDPTRARLAVLGKPFVLENVDTAGLRADLVLCGLMFGLEVIRHRVFELHGFTVPAPAHPSCRGAVSDGRAITVTGTGGGATAGDGRGRRKRFEGMTVVESRQRALGIPWMRTVHELREAIPPAYTRYIGGRLLAAVG